MQPEEKVFKLAPASISNKARLFAIKAGLPHLHTHSLRHKFATDLLERGANIKVLQELLGHDNLATTEVYLSVAEKYKRDAILLLDEAAEKRPGTTRAFERLRGETADKSSVSENATHEQTMRRLARALGDGIRFPSLGDKELMSQLPAQFKPGSGEVSRAPRN